MTNSNIYKKYPTTVGVELTYSVKKRRHDSYDKTEEVISEVSKLLGKIEPRYKKFCRTLRNNICHDSCVEIPTPILRNRRDADLAWHISEYATKNARGLQKRQLQTSGAHIHLGFNNSKIEDRQFFYNLTTWMVNRPWFAWAFNDPSDNINAQSWLSMELYSRSGWGDTTIIRGIFLKSYRTLKKTFDTKMFTYLFSHIQRKYTHIIRDNEVGGKPTIEFRFFEMPISYKRYHQHIDVALALHKRFHSHEVNEKLKFKNVSQLKEISLKESLSSFYDDLIELEFDPKDFKWAFKNIADRYSFGQEYLN